MGFVAAGTIPIGLSAKPVSIDSWAQLPVLGLRDREIAALPRLCGHGSFLAMWNGTQWRVMTGQTVISDDGPGDSSSGYTLTAAGTTPVDLVTYAMPAGMQKVGEVWAVTSYGTKSVHVSGGDALRVMLAGLQVGNVTALPVNAPSLTISDVNHFIHTATSIQRALGPGRNNDWLSGGPNGGQQSINTNRNVSAGFVPGGAGNVLTLQSWSLRRVA